mmetsp:Transcript_15384/g.31624  ORF Transcript_15384/g.31624 Transcript_15384/m.31624 type:complete len:201 (-) Transcript_15384:68-670(-)
MFMAFQIRALVLLSSLAFVVSFAPPASTVLKHRLISIRAADEEPPPAAAPLPVPTNFAEAEKYGLELFQKKNYEDSKSMFEQSLKLKGTGWDLTRLRTASPNPVGGASNQGGGFVKQEFASKEEVWCAKYNIACCQAQLGDKGGALETLDEVFSSGFEEFATVRKDTSLSLLGKDLEALLDKHKKDPFFKLPFGLGNKKK